jgi:cytochrome c oxidase subunit 4
MAHGATIEEMGAHEHAHPGAATYVPVAIILAVITITEVAVYYIQWLHDVGLIIPVLIILSICKFLLVIGYFMHLKFDNKLFTYIFGFGLIIGLSIVLSLMAVFHFHMIAYAHKLIT